VMLCINTDAHRQDMLGHMIYGVAMARRGWCEPRHILNTRPLDELLRWIEQRRAQHKTVR